METDEIIEIGIDNSLRLYLKPKSRSFNMIYRLAKGINWDNNQSTLVSAIPVEWTYLKWYNHIISTLRKDCNCNLILTDKTEWVNISSSLKHQIENEV